MTLKIIKEQVEEKERKQTKTQSNQQFNQNQKPNQKQFMRCLHCNGINHTIETCRLSNLTKEQAIQHRRDQMISRFNQDLNELHQQSNVNVTTVTSSNTPNRNLNSTAG